MMLLIKNIRSRDNMKDLQNLTDECIKEIVALGIKPGAISDVLINSRAKTRWGQCKAKSDGTFEIQISERLLKDDRVSDDSCKETIIHEILHTCEGCMKHTGKWKIFAERTNAAYGYNIKRTTSSSEKGIEEHISSGIMPKYMFTCRNCGIVIYRKRESKFTRNYRRYCCARCGAADWSRRRIAECSHKNQ